MSGAIIKLVNVEKCYDHHSVIDIPYLEFEENGLHIVVGANGSGKTTLLSMLAGIERIDLGRIYFKNEEADGKKLRRKVTLVLQSPYLFDTTVFNNIAYGLKVRAVPKEEIEEKVSVVLKRMGLEEFGERNGKQLSQGEMRKVAIARALVFEPDVLLLDEPTSDLDRPNTQLIEELIKGTRKTILMATQSTSQAHRLAEILVTIKNGRVSCDTRRG